MPLLLIVMPQHAERTTGLRVPGVTFSLVLICVAAFAMVASLQRVAGPTAEDALDAALDYSLRSPGLDHTELQHLCDEIGRPDCLERRAADPTSGDTFVAERAADGATSGSATSDTGRAVSPDPIPDAQRAHMERLVQQARETHLAQPAVALGLTLGRIRPHATITHLVVHAGVVTLIANMLLLWMALAALESAQNRWVLLGLVAAGGVAVDLGQMALSSATPLVPVLGAQGLVAVTVGAYLARFGRGRLVLWALGWLGRPLSAQVPYPAWVLLPVYLVWVVLAWLLLQEHSWPCLVPLIGLPVGFVLNMVLIRAGIGELNEEADARTAEDSPLSKQACSAIEREEWGTAVRIYRRLLLDFPDDDEVRIALAEALAADGQREEANTLFREQITQLLRKGLTAKAAQRYQQMGQVTGSTELPPDQLLTMADHFVREQADHYAVYTYERYLDSYPRHADRARALLGAIGLLTNQPEGRDRAVELLREAQRLIHEQPGNDYFRKRLEDLEAALHQLPRPHESRHEEVEQQGRVNPVDRDELSRNIDDWVSQPAHPMPRRRDPLESNVEAWVKTAPRDELVPDTDAEEPFSHDLPAGALSRRAAPSSPPSPAPTIPLPPPVAPLPDHTLPPGAPLWTADPDEDDLDTADPDEDAVLAPLPRDDVPTVPEADTLQPRTDPRASMGDVAPSSGDDDIDATTTSPWTPPGRRDPSTSAEYRFEEVHLPGPETFDSPTDKPVPHAGMDLDVPRALRSRILQPRVSALTAIEGQRLNFETADGAPFKVPIGNIQFIAVARIWYQEETVDGLESMLCDLVHGVHRTGSKVVVESVRLLSDRLPYGMLLPSAGLDDFANFRAVLNLMRPMLFQAQFIPGRASEIDGEIPTFSGLEQYERALLNRIARDD